VVGWAPLSTLTLSKEDWRHYLKCFHTNLALWGLEVTKYL